MNTDLRWSICCFLALVLTTVTTHPCAAQENNATLSGTVRDEAGKALPNAKVLVRNSASGETRNTQSDATGNYSVFNLPPGDYEVSISADGFGTSKVRTTLTAGGTKTIDATLASALSLNDLGFSQAQTQGNAQDQARLDKRSRMLKIHQRLGLIDTGPLIATVILGAGAGGRKTSTADRWAHLALGSATGDLYFLSAYYAIRAPKIPGTQTRGQIRWHKALAWIHGPGMILTPILGAMAFDQKSNGEKVHGIASAHGAVAIVTAAAYGAAILSVSVKF